MMSRIIELSDFECRMISIFAEETAKTQQAIEFGQKKSKPIGVHRIRAGDCLPGTKCRLLSDNYAVRFDDLDGVDSLKDYVAYMLKHEPRRQNGSTNQVQ